MKLTDLNFCNFPQVIFHTHTDYATALGCLRESEFPIIHQNGVRFYNRTAFHEDYGLPNIDEEAEALAKSMEEGNKDILFMCNHGNTKKGSFLKMTYF